MEKEKAISILICIIFMTMVGAAAMERIWVTSKSAKLKMDKKASSKTIEDLSVGTELIVKDFQRRWYQVSTNEGKVGWIYKGKVSKSPPEPQKEKSSGTSSIGGLLSGLSGGGISADTADTSRSIRGLSPETKEYAQKTGTSEEIQLALDEVLSKKINDVEIENFLQAGKVGEYAQ